MRPPAILRSSLIHFLLAGSALFLLRDFIGLDSKVAASDGTPRIRIDAARVDELRDGFRSRERRAPTPAELARLVSESVDEELLYREALARSLQASDDGVETRLAEKMLFLDDAAAAADTVDAAALAERARRLGLDQDDFVIRRILIEKLRLAATAIAPEELPTEAELARDYAERRSGLREPERRTLVHVFLSRDRRAARMLDDAQRLGQRIARERLASNEAIALGDAFPLGHVFARIAAGELERSFGGEVAARAFALPIARWSEPIESAYGLHLVRVEAIVPGAIPPFEAVRDRLRNEREERLRDQKLAALLATLRTRYEVAVAQVDEPRDEE